MGCIGPQDTWATQEDACSRHETIRIINDTQFWWHNNNIPSKSNARRPHMKQHLLVCPEKNLVSAQDIWVFSGSTTMCVFVCMCVCLCITGRALNVELIVCLCA